jgi:hypothetical protein
VPATFPDGLSPPRVRPALLFEPAIELLAADPDAATNPDRRYLPAADQLVGPAARDPQYLRHLRNLQILVPLLVHHRILRRQPTAEYRKRASRLIPGTRMNAFCRVECEKLAQRKVNVSVLPGLFQEALLGALAGPLDFVLAKLQSVGDEQPRRGILENLAGSPGFGGAHDAAVAFAILAHSCEALTKVAIEQGAEIERLKKRIDKAEKAAEQPKAIETAGVALPSAPVSPVALCLKHRELKAK